VLYGIRWWKKHSAKLHAYNDARRRSAITVSTCCAELAIHIIAEPTHPRLYRSSVCEGDFWRTGQRNTFVTCAPRWCCSVRCGDLKPGGCSSAGGRTSQLPLCRALCVVNLRVRCMFAENGSTVLASYRPGTEIGCSAGMCAVRRESCCGCEDGLQSAHCVHGGSMHFAVRSGCGV
jgi:hypothetical protein